MKYVIEIKNLKKSYGAITILDEVNLSIQEGETCAILGINGAGKTTLLECVEGLRKFQEGTIQIHKKYGVQLQSCSIPQNMKVNEALHLFSKWKNVKLERADLQKLGVETFLNHFYSTLSTGQKRRLHLALALLGNPDILFLDEPTAGLDVEGRVAMHREIQELKKQGKTIVLTSHDMKEVEELCDRIAILKEGKIVFYGTAKELTESREKQKVLKMQFAPALNTKSIKTAQKIYQDKSDYYFKTEKVEETLREITQICCAQKIKIVDVALERIGIEQRFLEVTKEEKHDRTLV